MTGCKKETAPLEFQGYSLELVSEKNCNPEQENCAFISITTPLPLENDKRGKRISQHIEDHIVELVDFQEENDFASRDDLARKFIENYETEEMEFPEYHIPWEASVEGEISHRSEEVITMQFVHAQFSGGAHGYTSVSYLNFDPETGTRLYNHDMFTEEFTAYAERLFREKFNIPADKPINSTGFFFERDEFYLPQNSGFVNNRLVLRYNAYEVASYSEGAVKLEIPLEQAKPYLKIF
jgi:hypothetical protein